MPCNGPSEALSKGQLGKQRSVNFIIWVVKSIRTLLHQLHIFGILRPNYAVLAIFIRPLLTLPLEAGAVAVVIAFVTAFVISFVIAFVIAFVIVFAIAFVMQCKFVFFLFNSW